MEATTRPNIYADEWDRSLDEGSFGLRAASVAKHAGSKQLGATVYEIPSGRKNLPYHAHFGLEELIVVLRGTPTLRSPEGERQLAEGEVVACPPGRDGAHQIINATDDPVRILIASTKGLADVIEYPDGQKVSAQAGQWGEPGAIAYLLPMEPQAGYFEGEE